MIGYYYYRNRERGGVSLINNSFVCLTVHLGIIMTLSSSLMNSHA